jgi:cytochrome P450
MSRYTSKAARLTENIGRRAWSVGSLFDQGSAAMSLLLNAFGRSVGIDLGRASATTISAGGIPKAVEEVMRTSTFNTLGGVPRYARTDFDFDGVTIQAGDLVLLDLGSANRDPAVFAALERRTSRASRPVTSLLDTVHTIA